MSTVPFVWGERILLIFMYIKHFGKKQITSYRIAITSYRSTQVYIDYSYNLMDPPVEIRDINYCAYTAFI